MNRELIKHFSPRVLNISYAHAHKNRYTNRVRSTAVMYINDQFRRFLMIANYLEMMQKSKVDFNGGQPNNHIAKPEIYSRIQKDGAVKPVN